MKAIEIVSRAMRLCRIVDAGEALNADEAQDALATLNAMLAEWHEADIGLPQYTFDSLQDTQDTDAADAEAMAYALAMRIAPEYGVEVSPAVAGMALDTERRLRLRYFQPGRVDAAMPSPTTGFDIERG